MLVRLLIVLGALLLGAEAAEAATCTWQGGTASWNNSNTASWSCGHVPTSSDAVVLDGTSGGGTVTVNSPNGAGVVTVQSITCGAFTGTLDFSANNNNVTLSAAGGFSGSGAGTRTINLGNGTWLLSATSSTPWLMSTTTGLTFNANNSTIELSGASGNRTFAGGGLTYHTVTFDANSGSVTISATGGAITIATLNITGPNAVVFPQGVTEVVTNAFSWSGSSGSEIYVLSSSFASTATVSVASGSPTMSWSGVRDMTFTGGATFTATNSFDLGHNSGITITAPVTGGGIIGGQ